MLREYSTGIVAADIVPNLHDIEVFPIDVMSEVDGELSATTLINEEIKLIDGTVYKSNLEAHSTITARWLPIGEQNSKTAPTLHKGERVRIYRLEDTDLFYWEAIGNEVDLRRREIKVRAFASRPSVEGELTPKNSYTFTIDTIGKMLRILTSIADGEACLYDVHMDLKEGLAYIKDNLGNQIELNSVTGVLTFDINSEFAVNTEKIKFDASAIIDFKTKDFKVNNTVTDITSTTSTHIQTPKFEVDNGVGFVATCIKLCDVMIAAQSKGDLGIPVNFEDGTIAKIESTKADFETFV